MAHTPTAKDIVRLAFEAHPGHTLTPTDVIDWYGREHGPMPVAPPAVRGAMRREAADADGSLARVAYGTYRARRTAPMRPGYRTPQQALADDDGPRAPAGPLAAAGTVLRLDLGNGTSITVRLVLDQDGPPLSASAVAVSSHVSD